MKKLNPAILTLGALAALAVILAYELTADASFNQSAEKATYIVDGNQFDGEHPLLMYLLSHPGHGDVIQHQCVVLTEELKFKKCTLSSRHL